MEARGGSCAVAVEDAPTGGHALVASSDEVQRQHRGGRLGRSGGAPVVVAVLRDIAHPGNA